MPHGAVFNSVPSTVWICGKFHSDGNMFIRYTWKIVTNLCNVSRRSIFRSSAVRMPLSYAGYPEFKRDENCFTSAHAHEIGDPYRWLEDPESPETKEFVDKQNELINPIINSYEDRVKIEKRLTELYDYERYGCPMKRADYYYYFHNSGLQNQSVLYRTKDLSEKGEIFLDPNGFTEDGTSSIRSYTFK